MFENTTNVPKILVLKSSSEQIFSRKLPLGAPEGFEFVAALISGRVNLVLFFECAHLFIYKPMVKLSQLYQERGY